MKRILLVWLLVFAVSVVITTGCADKQKQDSGGIQFPPAQAGQMKIVTFNIRYGTADDGVNHWDNRKQLVLDLLSGYAADVIGLQEALDFQIQQIQKALPEYGVYSVGRDDGERAGESCPILYRKDRFKVADSGTFWFSNSPWKPGSMHWGNTIPRICSWVQLTDIQTNSSFYVYNLHLDHQSQTSREQSARLLAKEIASRKTQDPFVVMGDFNMGLDNPALMYLQKIGYESPCPRLVSAWLGAHSTEREIGTYHGFQGTTTGAMIDHILITEQTTVLSAEIDPRHFDGRYPSDHFSVTAELKLY